MALVSCKSSNFRLLIWKTSTTLPASLGYLGFNTTIFTKHPAACLEECKSPTNTLHSSERRTTLLIFETLMRYLYDTLLKEEFNKDHNWIYELCIISNFPGLCLHTLAYIYVFMNIDAFFPIFLHTRAHIWACVYVIFIFCPWRQPMQSIRRAGGGTNPLGSYLPTKSSRALELTTPWGPTY